jgi:signal transduction histidine kinase
MENKNKVSISNRLFFKVYLNYAIMLTMFAVLLGIIYLRLYETNTLNSYKGKLQTQASAIAKTLARIIINEEGEDRYLEYQEIIDEINGGEPDIYTVSNSNTLHPMDKVLENVVLDDVELPDDFYEVIDSAFKNSIKYKSGYYEEFGGMSAILGVPVTVNGEIVGAVILRSRINEQKDIVKGSMYLIILSALVALLISFVIAILFAKGISTPISRMRITALELADGKYDSKTDINRKDEIGDLARTIDILSNELKESELERQNREQMRVDFFANVSHELRTPITVVRAYIESLVDGIVTEEDKVNQYYSRILSECKGMERLVGDLLLLSKMQNPDFLVEKEPVNIVQIFEDLIRSAHAISEEKNISIEIEKDQSTYMMMGDYDRLRQMFLIILDNSIKFTNENSTIHINLSKWDKLRISIRDEGIGIAQEELPSIFDKFYKSKLKQNEKGSGLGLAIAKQIALKHDGIIQVESTLGVGTEFIFYFQCLEDYVENLKI